MITLRQVYNEEVKLRVQVQLENSVLQEDFLQVLTILELVKFVDL